MSALAVVLAMGLSAQAPRTVYADEAKGAAGLAAYVGWESAGLLVQGANEEGRQAISLSYLYESHGIEFTRARAIAPLRSKYASLLFRDHSGVTLQLKGGTGFEFGGGWAVLGRLGTEGGAFSAVLGPSVGIQGIVARGAGITGRVPTGLDLGLEGRIGPVAPFVVIRPWADLWPYRHPVYHAEIGFGIGVL